MTPAAAVQGTGPDGAPPPPANARTAEQFDTTSAEERAAATRPKAAAARRLGSTVVSLGSPSVPGFWLETPLVGTQTPGRVTNPDTGRSAAVTLIPIDGPATAGSRLSLPAMRLIGASLAELTTIEVSSEG
ncbi:hypothetical protein AB1M95_11805 [Sulfitobacter sp. LCG007]